jgi:hypothetical protein
MRLALADTLTHGHGARSARLGSSGSRMPQCPTPGTPTNTRNRKLCASRPT